ncbi:MAG: hypothetical protein HFG93_07975 [Dorea sp.]|jgi:uncharacterized protein YjdB|nr:hypothetical protein [Dorea sp.]
MRTGNLRKTISLVLSFIMVLSICLVSVPGEVKAAGAGTISISANKSELHRGDLVDITVSLSGNETATGVNAVISYDSDKLQLQGNAKLGDAKEGAFVSTVNDATPGSISAIVAMDGENYVNGVLFTAQFLVKDTAKGKLDVSVLNTDFTDIDYNSVTPSIMNNTADMRVVVPVTGISLNKMTASIARGTSEQLTAVLAPADADSTITWTSSNPAVASVSVDGTVTAVTAGSTVITASAEGKSASCTVTVTVPLNGITITGGVSAIKKGTTTKLDVTYDPADTTDSKAVTWTTSDSKIATVDSTGLVTAVADGTVTITAKVGSKTATHVITVKEVKLTAISIKPATTIHRGENEKLTVAYTPEDTTDDRTVTWTSTDTNVAVVDGDGNVTAKAKGQAIIKAAVGSLEAQCTVTVDAPLESINPTKPSIDLIKNQTEKITYKLNPEDTTDDKTVTFASSAEDVVSVGPDGTLTAKKEGTATVTMTGANGITATVAVNVKEIPIDQVVLDKNNAEIEKGETTSLTATIGPENNTDDDKQIRWESSDTSIVTVDKAITNPGESVTITATNKGGKAVITAKAANGTSAVCEINVPIHIESISMDSERTINRGTTEMLEETLKLTFNPENTTDERTLTWTSSNPAVATVDAGTGMIHPLKEGTTKVTATTVNGKTAEADITVKENHLTPALADDIKFTRLDNPILKNQTLNMHDILNLAEIIEDNQITDTINIQWTSSKKEIATVDQSGRVTGLKEGTTYIEAVITATDGEGREIGKYTVGTDVEVKEIPLKSIAFNKIIKEMQVGATEVLSVIYNPEDTTDPRDVEWSTSDAGIISVENGKITALKAGMATITAKVGDKTVSCEIEVKGTSAAGGAAGGNTGRNDAASAVRNGGAQTGDTSNIIVYLVLILMSLITMFVLRYRKLYSAR